MPPQPHQRKAEINFNEAENLTLDALKQMHPEWVRKNGDCPSCIALEHVMADTSDPEAARIAMNECGL
jgi:hypothetical protein